MNETYDSVSCKIEWPQLGELQLPPVKPQPSQSVARANRHWKTFRASKAETQAAQQTLGAVFKNMRSRWDEAKATFEAPTTLSDRQVRDLGRAAINTYVDSFGRCTASRLRIRNCSETALEALSKLSAMSDDQARQATEALEQWRRENRAVEEEMVKLNINESYHVEVTDGIRSVVMAPP